MEVKSFPVRPPFPVDGVGCVPLVTIYEWSLLFTELPLYINKREINVLISTSSFQARSVGYDLFTQAKAVESWESSWSAYRGNISAAALLESENKP